MEIKCIKDIDVVADDLEKMSREELARVVIEVSNKSGARITLLPTQVKHLKRMMSIYSKFSSAVDTSVMGSGKTYVALAIAILLGLPIFTVCPKNARRMWIKKAGHCGVKVIEIITYGTLRSKKGCKPAHPWLVRRDEIKGKQALKLCITAVSQNSAAIEFVPANYRTSEIIRISNNAPRPTNPVSVAVPVPGSSYDAWLSAVSQDGLLLSRLPAEFATFEMCMAAVKQNGLALKHVTFNKRTLTKFTPTEALKNIAKEGVHFVFDEAHKARGSSAQTLACHALMKAVFDSADKHAERKSTVQIVSGTPGTLPVEYCRHMRFMGVYKEDALYRFDNGKLKLLGAASVITASLAMDRSRTCKIVEQQGVLSSGQVILDLCFKLYVDVIQDHLTSAMVQPDGKSTLIQRAGLFKLDAFPEDEAKFSLAVKRLESIAFRKAQSDDFSEDGPGVLNTQKLASGEIVKVYEAIENAKVRSVVAHMVEAHEDNPRTKLALACFFKSSIALAVSILKQAFGEDRVGVITGSVKDDEREDIVCRFQQRYPEEDEDEDEEDAIDVEYDDNDMTLPLKRQKAPRVVNERPALIALVGQIETVSTAISLDDCVGDEPRIAYMMCNNDVINTHQFGYRFKRAETVGTSLMYLCYGYVDTANGHLSERSMLDAINRRSLTLLKTLPAQNAAGILFPGEYPKRVIANAQDQ